jgi:hypothetical protein
MPRDLLVSVEAAGAESRMVAFAEVPEEGLSLIIPGQKKGYFTFLVSGVPAGTRPESVAARILPPFQARTERPGKEWHVSYLHDWESLKAGGPETGVPGITLSEAAGRTGWSLSAVERAVKQGRLPATRLTRVLYGGQGINVVAPADVDRWLAANPVRPQGRPPRKQP